MKKIIIYNITLFLILLTSEVVLSQHLTTNASILKLYKKYNVTNRINLFDNTTQYEIIPEKLEYISNKLSDTSKNIKKNKIYKVNPWKLTAVAVAGAGVFTAMHIYYKNTWWVEQRKYFKYAEDGYYARNIDKLSHIYTANVFTVITAEAYEWTGINPTKSLLYGSITALAYETYIEINDGFAPNWGFDWGDMAGNIFGAIYPHIQKHVPVMQNFTFKWSVKPEWLRGKVENTDDLLDDYTNMTFWLGISPEGLLPKKMADLYPGFLGIAIGMSIKNASHVSGSTNAYTEWFISLDYDMTKLPGNSDFMKKLKKILNFYHFPAPAVRVSPSGIWYGLYF
jgi:hypothetical protein